MFAKSEEIKNSPEGYMRTEKWALEEEKREQEWQETYGGRIGDYICKINGLLAAGTMESRMQIKEMFRDAEFSDRYRQMDIFAELYVIMCIYEAEVQAGVAQTILEQSDTIEGLRSCFFQLRLILYRLDFDIGCGVDEELLAYLKKYKVSTVQLGIQLITAVMRPLSVSLKLEKLFDKNHMQEYLLYILEFMESHWKGNYREISKLAQMYEDSEDRAKAEYYRDKIPQFPEGLKDGKDERKICFIACVNSDAYEQELLKYLNNLIVPEGYGVEYLSIREAKSMAAGYNEGMRGSDAKYKVYLHQDAFIVNPYFIWELLDIFQEDTIGMAGMVGAPEMPENAVMWSVPRVGKLYANQFYSSRKIVFGEVEGKYREVEAVDGLLMATQYDLPWREDLFQGWDFYDVSQSREFMEHGYRVVVPDQGQPWCIHTDGFSKLKDYYKARRIFQEEYGNNR